MLSHTTSGLLFNESQAAIIVEFLREEVTTRGLIIREVGCETVWRHITPDGNYDGFEMFIGRRGTLTHDHAAWEPVRFHLDDAQLWVMQQIQKAVDRVCEKPWNGTKISVYRPHRKWYKPRTWFEPKVIFIGTVESTNQVFGQSEISFTNPQKIEILPGDIMFPHHKGEKIVPGLPYVQVKG